jgi:hypothetical protein
MKTFRSLEEQVALEAELSAAERQMQEMLRQKYAPDPRKEVVKKIARHMHARWKVVKSDNQPIRQETIKHLARSRGEYESNKLTAIKAFKGSEAFFRTGETKCRAAGSWITDIYRGDNDLPWQIEPTAIPTLPGKDRTKIQEDILQQGIALQDQMTAQALENGIPVDPARIAKTMNELQEVAIKQAMERIQKDAKAKCDRAALQIRDDNQEGGWNNAFKDFLWYFLRTHAGIIKGPVTTKIRKDVWQEDGAGGFRLVSEWREATDVYCVSPFKFYPAKGIASVNDGDVFEVHDLNRQSISEMIDVPGYDSDEIRAVLAQIDKGDLKGKWLQIDDETQVRNVLAEKNPTGGSTDYDRNTIHGLEFYGTLHGSMLLEWGLTEEGILPETDYQVNCWMIGDHVIKAVINSDSKGRKPYHVSSWAKNPAWIFGEGLIQTAAPIEDIQNSIIRAFQNNIGIASGPQVVKNKDVCDDKTPLFPWKVWEVTSMQMKEGKPLDFFQPNMHAQELIASYEFFSKVLDEMTVPAYAQGASQAGVTTGTATVYTSLLAAASRSIKAVVANIDDDIIAPYIQMCYDVLMQTTKDPALQGDGKVVAKGVAGLLAKEQQAQRKTEFLQTIAVPTFAQALGAKNIGYILAQIAKSNDLKLPDMDRLEGNETLESILTKMNLQGAGVDPNQQNGNIATGGTPQQPQSMTLDGRPAGSPEMQQPAQI